MGVFMSMTAVRLADPAPVADAVIGYASAHGIAAAVDHEPPGTGERDIAQVTPAGNGWNVIFWSKYFVGLGPASRWLSGDLDTLTSAVDIYDGDLWNHLLFQHGELVDRFSSCPDYFTTDRNEKAQLRRAWAGSPDTVGEAFGVEPAMIAGYLLHPYSSGLFGRALRNRRIHPDDKFELGNVWVFVDFWRRLGIDYPEPGTVLAAPEVVVRFDGEGSKAMPSGGTEFSL